ncbi:MAG: phosphotransferase [candidate division WOR-3 bacterium]|nr:phosphotransferase [candidate division WOR-3 bacterium]
MVKLPRAISSKYEFVTEIKTGGSDREFYRIKKNRNTYILIKDKNIEDYIKLLLHFLKIGVGVPELVEYKDNYAIVEDLGSYSLYELVRSGCKDWKDYYKKAIKELIKIQVDGFKNAPLNNYYDAEHIKWEQDYFKEFFLKQYCGLPEEKIFEIDDELCLLHKKVCEAIKPISNFLMHRDYQSQNIFIKNGKIRVVDFQSARIGPLTYDLVSLLRDAYVDIDKRSEDSLIEYYLDCLKKKGIKILKRDFYEIYSLTAIQRHMQALGAFANLSLNKNKVHFKQFIPRGLKLLTAELKNSEFSKLYLNISSIKQLNNCSIVQK